MARPSLGVAASRSNDAATFSDTPFKQVAPLKKPDVDVKTYLTDTQPPFWAKGNGTTIQGTNWTAADFSQRCRVLGGGTLQGSPNNGSCAIMKTNGSDGVDAYELEFWHPGDTICLHLVVFDTDGSDIRVFIDDVPTERVTKTINAAGTWFLVIEGYAGNVLTPYTKKVRVSMGRFTFVQMVWSVPGRNPRPTLPKKAVGVVGDSYSAGNFISGGLGNIFEGTWVHQLKAAGLEVIPLAQPGTGYVNNASGNTAATTALGPLNSSHFGSNSRLAVLLTQYNKGLRDLIIFGGANDSSIANSIVFQAAKDYFAALNAQMPNLRVYVIGVQSAIYSNTDMDGTNTQIKNAALAAPNVKAFIDQRATPAWVYGSGKVGATNGNGNADWVIAADGVHCSKDGYDWVGTMALEALGSARTAPL